MRYLILILLCTLTADAQMLRVKRRAVTGTQVTRVQGTYSSSPDSSTANTAFASDNTSGNTIIACAVFSMDSGTNSISSISDSRNTYTLLSSTLQTRAGASTVANIYSQCGIATNIGAGSNTVTVTLASAAKTLRASITEVSAGVLDTSGGGTGDSAFPSAGSVSASTKSLTLAICYLQDGFGFASGWFTAGSGFTLREQFGGGLFDGATQTKESASSETITASFGSNFSGTTGPWVSSFVTVKP